MSQPTLPLYPKLSSIYNKIMQLAIAIALIIILLNVLIFDQQKSEEVIEAHFEELGQQYARQTAQAIAVLMPFDKKGLKRYVETLLPSELITSVHFYDITGRLLYSSNNAKSVKQLYGFKDEENISRDYVPFVEEIRTENIEGYVRVTLKKSLLTQALQQADMENSERQRVLMVIAGIVGFFLTRGLSRFSRQGFRLSKQ